MVQMKNIYYRAFIERVTLVLAGIGIVGMVLLGGCRKELPEWQPREGAERQSLDSLLRVVGVMPSVDSTGYLPRQEGQGIVKGRAQWRTDVGPKGYYRPVENRYVGNGTYAKPDFTRNVNENIVWPGNIITVESARAGNVRDFPELNPERAEGRVSLGVVNGGTSSIGVLRSYKKSDVYAVLNGVLASHQGHFPAEVQLSISQVQNFEELRYYLGGSSVPDAELEEKMKGVDWTSQSQKIMVRLNQVYFRMLFDDPEQGWHGLFQEGADYGKIGQVVGASAKSHLGYISSVSYGRTFVLVFEGKDFSMADLIPTIRKMLATKDADERSRLAEQLKGQMELHYHQVGGQPIDPGSVVAGDWGSLFSSIVSGAEVSSLNVAKPIAYTVRYLSNGELAEDEVRIKADYKLVEYERVRENGTVYLRGLRARFQGTGNRPIGGNYDYISNESYVNVNYVHLEAWEGSKKLIDEGLCSRFGLSVQDGFNIDVANEKKIVFSPGVSTREIRLSFSVKVYLRRYNDGLFGGDVEARRTYNRTLILRYNDKQDKECWEIVSDGEGYVSDTPFHRLGIYDFFERCNIRFSLDYSFSTEFEFYYGSVNR